MSTLLFILAAVLAAVSTLLFSKRTGERMRYMSLGEGLVHFGMLNFLAASFVGLFARAYKGGTGGEFLWFHWPFLGAGALVIVGYVLMFRKRSRRYEDEMMDLLGRLHEVDTWLAEVEQLTPCVTVDCRVFRDGVPEKRRILQDPIERAQQNN